MKLARRYNQANLLTSFVILVITGFIYYFAIHYILNDQLNRDLVIEESEIEAYVKNHGQLPSPGDFLHQKVSFSTPNNGKIIERVFFDDQFYNEKEQEFEPGRSLITSVQLKGKTYQVTISKSRVEAEGLLRLIFMITLSVTILLLISLLLINKLVLQQIWRPFYGTLSMMKSFSITQKDELKAIPTKIDEFSELNTAVANMANRVKKDYSELKTFTDNASHEMMTPLAVINSKLDLLLQGKPLEPEQGELIDEIYHAVGRLSRLNHALLLLAKIENNLVPEPESFDLKALVLQKLQQFQELFQNKEIKLVQDLSEKQITMSKYLADILLNNLLSNALRHNDVGGLIELKLNADELVISNSGNALALDQRQAFERFYKAPSSEGMGLGLAIIKQIAALHQFNVNYSHENGLHIFRISFSTSDCLQG